MAVNWRHSRVVGKCLATLCFGVRAAHIGGVRCTHRKPLKSLETGLRASHPPYPPSLRGRGRDREGPASPGEKRKVVLQGVWCAWWWLVVLVAGWGAANKIRVFWR